MKFLGSDSKPVVRVSDKQVSDLQAKKEPVRGYNLYSASVITLAKKLENKRESAKDKGTDFSLQTNTIGLMELINKSKGLCGYTNKQFIDANDVTFERIDPNIGYTMDNTIFCCLSANNLKSNLDAFEKGDAIPDAMKVKLMNKAIYRLNKKMGKYDK